MLLIQMFYLLTLTELKKYNLSLNVATFNNYFIDLAVRRDQINLALEHFNELKKNNIKPNHYSYGSIIDWYSRKGDHINAMKYFDTMVMDNIAPTQFTFAALLAVLAKNQKIEQVHISKKESLINLIDEVLL